jgi:SAM-dependent methyltransferase
VTTRAKSRIKRRAATLDEGAVAHYRDAAYYDKTYGSRRADVDYYVALAKKVGGPILEYGVGNGRVALEIARLGVDVVGIDASRAMLDDLEVKLAKAPRLKGRFTTRLGDMRRVRLKRRFPLIIAPFNVVLHLYARDDVEQFLARVREHLAPGGRFVFDFSAPRVADLAVDPARKYGAPRVRHPSHGGVVKYAERFEYDDWRQTLWCLMEFTPVDGSPSWEVPLAHRQFFPQEMAALLHYNGFPEQIWTQDFADQPATAEADSLVVTCGTQKSRRSR